MKAWIASVVDRPVGLMMVVIAIVVFGWISMTQLPVNLMPDVSFPTITVRGTYDGAAPLEVEREIIDPLEQVLRTVEGVKEVESVSRPGSGEIYLRFHWGTNLDVATQRIRERIALASLRDGISQPRILRYDPALDPVFRLALSGRSTERLGRYARDELVPALTSSPGVALVQVRGDGHAQISVEVDPKKLARYGLTIQRIQERLNAENLSLVGGKLQDHGREILIRIDSEMRSLHALEQLVVTRMQDVPVRLVDVATIKRIVQEPDSFTTWNGETSVEIDVYREADANIVSVVDGLNARLYEGKNAWVNQLPPGVHLDVSEDASRYVRAAIQEVSNNAIMGAIYAVLVLFIFLRAMYPTLVISLAIPLSVIAVFAPLRSAGITLNIMSLGGLALGVGMVVDNAVVVLEAIYRRIELGDSPRKAALTGTGEVAGAVVASTLTTVAVFAPIVFMKGMASIFFRDLGVAVALALVASLAFSLFFVPTMLALRERWLPSKAGRSEMPPPSPQQNWWSWTTWRQDRRAWQNAIQQSGPIGTAVRWLLTPVVIAYLTLRLLLALMLEAIWRLMLRPVLRLGTSVGTMIKMRMSRENHRSAWRERIMTRYQNGIRWVLRQPWVVWLAMICLFGGAAFAWPRLGMELIPKQQQDTFFLQLALPSSTPVHDVVARTRAIEKNVLALPKVAATASSVGEDASAQNQESRAATSSRIRVQIESTKTPERTHDEVLRAIRDVLQDEPGVTWSFEEENLVSTPPAIRVEIVGNSLDTLRQVADQVASMLHQIPGAIDIRNRQQLGKDELVVHLNPQKMAAFGLSAQEVADQLRTMSRGTRGTTIRLDEERLDAYIRASSLNSLEALQALAIPLPNTAFGAPEQTGVSASIAGIDLGDVLQSAAGTSAMQARHVQLASIAEFEIHAGPSEIRHIRGRRTAIVEANANVRDVQGLSARVEQQLQDVPRPQEVDVRLSGESGDIREASGSLVFALALAIFLVYAVMASLFESFVGPLLIMISVPLAVAAVLLALFVAGFPISILVAIGMIVLVGIVVNNAIVLVDTMLQLEREGQEREDAISHASSIRLRPVLITAMTTILGLLPMLFARGEGAEIRQPIALVLVVGLSVSTLLTLIVIPVLYQQFMPTVRAPSLMPSPDEEVVRS